MDVYLNQTFTSTMEISWNEELNITILYKDKNTTRPLDGATVELQWGAKSLGSLVPLGYPGLYNITINTSSLETGLIFLTVSAELDNYTAISKVITISITRRDTELDVYLNTQFTNTYQIPWKEDVNITVVYKDFEHKYFLPTVFYW